MGDTTRTRSFPYSVDGPATGTAFMSVGMNDKVSFTNQATKAGKLTVKITGYSTQVTADAINGSGGVSGQVLTNTGGGNVEWRNSTGGGTGTTVQEYSVHVDGPVTAFSFSPKVAQVTAPAGVYAISVRGTVTSGGDPSCIVRNGGNASDPELFDLGVGLGNLVGKKTEVAVISGPAISLTCHSQNFAVLTDVTIVATRLGNSAY
ncbi:MAG: hypothetical protein NTX33_11300 [Propionibacteriales bacterium]|nr:hypothetical protein [Propionibacteriales bacterium]